ncbi:MULTISPECIES: acetyl-CoA C-acetyltransferase [unclassified Thermoactinomyces]|uniref:acetyl-CoA C-acetyltransferase n=1 Tax=unclassified Thermoactinomyces TaxID=2634588 RepID=UPI0018DBBB9B|nr:MULTISPECIES: acetyl-CoA C-acetyltransferase [unclassified Thermoactinomyces]MBH8597878.1 acetyl-CoA C-acetyltransferase [Thermoactinomyces sp. CICC 10523]MBH8604230.1 acetyl-CoA C-acetyltransferase [Thermoactinomyces sp. CICC 10522]
MVKAVILGGARTPFGKFGGALKDVPAVELGGTAIRAALERAGVEVEMVDEVIMGMVLQGGAGQIPSRQAARLAGLGWEVGTETINKVCASGLRSVTLADQIIRAGDAGVVVAGGMESMSNAPYILPSGRFGQRMGDGKMVDLMIHDGLWCAFHDVHMIVHGSNTAKEYNVTREEQDAWALRSHQRALEAINHGRFADEITPVTVKVKKQEIVVDRDEAVRADTTLEKLSGLKPVYLQDGTITAGNAPGVNDGAAALVVASSEKAQELGIKPLASILGHAAVAMEAKDFPITPAYAIKKLLKKHGLTVAQIDLFEINEAFAAVALANSKLLEIDPGKLNVNGGAVALGHPIGASGARILLTLIMELKRRGGGLGVAAICSGAAQGDAVLVKVEG